MRVTDTEPYVVDKNLGRKLVQANDDLPRSNADGEPVGKDLTITVLRSEVQKQNPVLEAVPWIANNPQPTAQVTVEEIKVTTDPKTGKGTAILNLKKGGVHTLRASES